MLRGSGYVSIASTIDPVKVCELHFANRYDLILLDLQMPGMDGFQVTDATRRHLGKPFVFEERGVIDVKGKSEMHTWFLNGRDG